MHVEIDRLYDFVMGRLDLEDSEQSHLIRCDFCVEWLDACVTEKIVYLLGHLTSQADVTDLRQSQ